MDETQSAKTGYPNSDNVTIACVRGNMAKTAHVFSPPIKLVNNTT